MLRNYSPICQKRPLRKNSGASYKIFMKISFFHNETGNSDVNLIPLHSASGQLSSKLDQIALTFGLPSGLLQRDFKGLEGEIHFVYGQKTRLILLGLGETPGFPDIVKAFRSFSYKYKNKIGDQISIHFLYQDLKDEWAEWIEAGLSGLILGCYQIGLYKTTVADSPLLLQAGAQIEIGVPLEQKAVAEQAAAKGQAVAKTQMRIFDLVNAPSNYKRPQDLASWALSSGREFGYSVKVMEKEEIQKTGLEALLAVNQGSADPPVFIIMEYIPAQTGVNTLKKIGLVGKGVTFDTGGLSIKPSTNMHYMKSDMGGAGAVFGAMEVAAKLQLPIHLVGIVPATDNCVDARSVKPSDVIGSYSKKTIEIIDTDAEGRLILADGLSYVVQHYQPDVLINLATLTGSAVRTFGYHAAALFSNNDQTAAQMARIGERIGERVWRLPLWDIYEEDLKSDVADVRNFSGKPVAGAIGAAKFLEFFTHDHPNWTHLDIAGVAFGDSEFTTQKSASAFGVRLLTEFLLSLTNN